MKFRNIIFIVLSITFLVSCNGTKKEGLEKQTVKLESTKDAEIESISVLYYNYLFIEKYLIPCDGIKLSVPDFEKDHRGVLDAIINDSKVLEEIKEQLVTLEPSTDNYLIDARITATINYKNGRQDELCIGQMDANTIFLNGIQQKMNNRLLYLIKNNIGYYPWMIGDGLQEMTELKDNSFMKEPFISNDYYKNWQKIRNR